MEEPVDFRTMVDQLQEPLRRFVLGFIRDRHAAEDLVQETFLRVMRNLHRYRGQASLKTWIFAIARNLCLDYLKAAGRSRLRLLDALDSTERDLTLMRRAVPDSLCPDPGRRVDLDENRARVGRALTRLGAEARTLLILRVHLGLSYREIARCCRVAPAGVGTRIARALRGLSRSLG